MAPLMDATATTDELAPLTTRLRALVDPPRLRQRRVNLDR